MLFTTVCVVVQRCGQQRTVCLAAVWDSGEMLLGSSRRRVALPTSPVTRQQPISGRGRGGPAEPKIPCLAHNPSDKPQAETGQWAGQGRGGGVCAELFADEPRAQI